MSKHLLCAAAAALLSSMAAHAEEALPAALQSLTERGVKVVKRFEAPSELQGYVVQAGGRSQVLYVTPDGEHLLLGALLDRQGNNLTETHTAIHVLAEAWDTLEETRWVGVGAEDPKRVIYVLADPYCPYCHAFWNASRAYWDAGLQARWIMVSYLRPDGPDKIAAILEADDPAQALAAHQDGFEQGGIDPATDVAPATLMAVRDHTALMAQLGINGTPAILYQDGEGGVRLIQGMPRLGELPQIFRLPEQEIDAAGLERFR